MVTLDVPHTHTHTHAHIGIDDASNCTKFNLLYDFSLTVRRQLLLRLIQLNGNNHDGDDEDKQFLECLGKKAPDETYFDFPQHKNALIVLYS